VGWNIGDSIFLGPSGRDVNQHEKKTIAAINVNQITLTTPLLYDHFGALDVTIIKDGIG